MATGMFNPAVSSEMKSEMRLHAVNACEDKRLRRQLERLHGERTKRATDLDRQREVIRQKLGRYKADKAEVRDQKQVSPATSCPSFKKRTAK